MKHKVTTVCDNWRLALVTQAQSKTMERLGARALGLAITGVLKAANAKRVYLIARNGSINFQGKKLS